MAIEIKVPRLGWTMEEGTFIEWLKCDGDFVKPGDPLFTIEGDKAVQDVEAIDSGILCIPRTGPTNGDVVKVGMTLGFLLAPNESAPTATIDKPQLAPVVETKPSPPVLDASPTNAQGPMPNASRGAERLRISPRASRIAAELGIDCSQIQGTGRNGRIRERDVHVFAQQESHVSAGPTKPTQPTSSPSFRRTIAARMTAGAQSTAPVTLTTTADATNLVSLRAQFKAAAKSDDEVIPSYADLITKLAARALLEHPELNQQWIDGRIADGDGIHIAIAVDTPAGLVAPVLRDVPSLGLREIAAHAKDLKARPSPHNSAPRSSPAERSRSPTWAPSASTRLRRSSTSRNVRSWAWVASIAGRR